jgi:hypothetical protein
MNLHRHTRAGGHPIFFLRAFGCKEVIGFTSLPTNLLALFTPALQMTSREEHMSIVTEPLQDLQKSMGLKLLSTEKNIPRRWKRFSARNRSRNGIANGRFTASNSLTRHGKICMKSFCRKTNGMPAFASMTTGYIEKIALNKHRHTRAGGHPIWLRAVEG